MTSERSFISSASAREPSEASARANKHRSRSRTKNTKSVAPIKVERNEGRLLPSNFKAFKWKNLTELNVEDCKNDITHEMIQKCDKTLDYLEFTGLTNFRNVKLLIRTCTNIQSLNFTDIVLNNYGPDYNIVVDVEGDEQDQNIDRNYRDRRRDSENGNQIITITKLRALRKLTFYGLGSLSVHELHIFDFLYESIHFDRLKSLYFISQKSDYWNTSSANIFKSNLDATVLSRFLNQNWTALKSLKVNRTDLVLYDDSKRHTPKIVNIQLVKFECDMSGKGFKKLLENQTELQVLHIYNKNLTRIDDFDDILVESLRRCSETLKDVRISYNMKHRENPIDFQENEDPRILNHDCRMYKYCRRLKKLHICVSRVHEPEFPESFKIRPGGIINVHLIPTTIKYLTIQFDEIHKKDMKSFAAVFSTFENLKYFVFEGKHEDRPYRLKIPWILTVADLPKIQYFKFTCCRIEDLAAIEVITQSLPSLFLEVSDTTCAYYRSQKIKSKFK